MLKAPWPTSGPQNPCFKGQCWARLQKNPHMASRSRVNIKRHDVGHLLIWNRGPLQCMCFVHGIVSMMFYMRACVDVSCVPFSCLSLRFSIIALLFHSRVAIMFLTWHLELPWNLVAIWVLGDTFVLFYVLQQQPFSASMTSQLVSMCRGQEGVEHTACAVQDPWSQLGLAAGVEHFLK